MDYISEQNKGIYPYKVRVMEGERKNLAKYIIPWKAVNAVEKGGKSSRERRIKSTKCVFVCVCVCDFPNPYAVHLEII